MNLSRFLGQFIGAILAECAPVLVEIISHAIQKSKGVEDGMRDDDLRTRLLDKLHSYDNSSKGGTSTDKGNDKTSESVGKEQ